MLKNHFLIAWRALNKNRMFTILNISGLTIGIAGFFMILFFIVDEKSYDRFYGHSESIYRVTSHWGIGEGSQYATAPPPLGRVLGENFPEVEAVTRILKWNDFTVQPESGPNADQIFREASVFYAEPNFFEVFDFEILAGNPNSLSGGKSVILTESTAKRYFGDITAREAVGKNILIGSGSTDLAMVGAVIKDIPVQSHFHFDMLVHNLDMHREIFLMDNWMWSILHTYVKIPNGEVLSVEGKLGQVVTDQIVPRLSGEQSGTDFFFGLQPVQDIHLHSHLLREHEANSYESYVNIFSIVAGIILLLASINFMNLSTAKGAKRSMEVGVRKVMGSSKFQLVGQFLTEAFFLVVASTFLAMVLVELLNGTFNEISNKQIQFNIFQFSWIWGVAPILIILLTLMAGFYPAFYLSSFKPLKVIKGVQMQGKNTIGLRSGLVVFQFSISLILIICALVVQRQLSFIQNTNVGFDREQLLIIHNDGEIKNEEREDFKRRFASSSSVSSLSFSTGIPLPGNFQMRNFNLPQIITDNGMNWYEADHEFVSTLNMEIVEGRNFTDIAGSDKYKVLINEKAAKVLGISDKAIGQKIIKNRGDEDEAELEVVGILKDFNFESLRQEIKPLVIEYMDDYFLRDYITVRLNPENFEDGIAELQENWKLFEPRVPMNYSFLDADFQAVYQSELQMGKLMNALTVMSIFIAFLGLFGLTAYSVQQRAKEIGIRKVFGAGESEIFLLLSSGYMKLILIACLIAIPMAYFLVSTWLDDFAFRIPFELWVFATAGLGCFVLAIFTVAIQSFKSIGTNPISILKSE
ncbi:ABC transporter permease [Aquiflexum gelatinilyticum]|uniref:ABC transporter permease n=1 Tax=Aquiflexum gelatinilyticum TaxID=2961943 RepID=A0A9X2P4V2_9BACT|nr:ABC transporter permease [Aquiflexum gelatinilyticum]MCR9015352.1 ABC transporter permease [Aquiflexum gelatinilyticum]